VLILLSITLLHDKYRHYSDISLQYFCWKTKFMRRTAGYSYWTTEDISELIAERVDNKLAQRKQKLLNHVSRTEDIRYRKQLTDYRPIDRRRRRSSGESTRRTQLWDRNRSFIGLSDQKMVSDFFRRNISYNIGNAEYTRPDIVYFTVICRMNIRDAGAQCTINFTMFIHRLYSN